MGNTGVGAQLHLHFEVRINNVTVDPEPYLEGVKTVAEMTLEEAKKVAKEKVGLDDNTIQYLLFYKYGEALIKKIAIAAQ